MMHRPMRLDDIAGHARGRLIGDVVDITGVCIDSREAVSGDLFVAIAGNKSDGHDFAADAVWRGAGAVLASRKLDCSFPQVLVPDTVLALGRIAAYVRSLYDVIAIGVTGSVGKTTSKDMIALVTGAKYETLKTKGNYNTEIGVPLTILELRSEHEAIVVEMGMRGSGQIAYLADMVKPNIGVVTNVGTAHVELTGSIDQTARCKRELLAALPDDGVAIINGDDAWCEWMTDGLGIRVLSYSVRNGGDVRAQSVESTAESVSFTLITPEDEARVTIPVPGRHLVLGALAAASVGYVLGISAHEIAGALAGFHPGPMRSRVMQVGDVVVIDDTYNASFESLQAGLELVNDVAAARQILVLGPMLDLGEQTAEIHGRAGEHVAGCNVDLLLTVGELGRLMADGAEAAGMSRKRIIAVDTNEQALNRLQMVISGGDTILVKGSRGAAMDEIVSGLMRRGA